MTVITSISLYYFRTRIMTIKRNCSQTKGVVQYKAKDFQLHFVQHFRILSVVISCCSQLFQIIILCALFMELLLIYICSFVVCCRIMHKFSFSKIFGYSSVRLLLFGLRKIVNLRRILHIGIRLLLREKMNVD